MDSLLSIFLSRTTLDARLDAALPIKLQIILTRSRGPVRGNLTLRTSAKNPKLLSDPTMDSPTVESLSRCVGILTSGGDAQGMNAAVRSTVRMAIFHNIRVYGVYEGYQGLVDGGEYIKELKWSDVSGKMHCGGTMLGTARCEAFRKREGRLKAAQNMLKCGMNNLVVIGGDGSLTGANVFRSEWSGLVQELVEKKLVSKEEAEKYSYLNIVGMVGSIDNDMHGTDMTIGTDSALHRIIDAVDCIMSTADSHQRSFVVEVMGRHCGYLALMAGIAGAADWVLIPEKPPKPGWEKAMCRELKMGREQGRRMALVMVAEGAIDQECKPITASMVKDILVKELQHDVRITVLGHVQRGGNPSAYDRILGSRMGAEAAITISEAEGSIDSVLIGIEGNKITRAPLMEKVIKTQEINEAMKKKDFEKALKLRGTSFQSNLKILRQLNRVDQPVPAGQKLTFAVMCVGAPACGMNSAIYTFVRQVLYKGHKVLCIQDGFEGLERGEIEEVTWITVNGWSGMGGCNIKTNRTVPNDETLPKIAENLKKHKINGLYLIGGFEGYESLIVLEKARQKHPELKIPLFGTAATISNNVPGSDYSLGSDTALNAIVNACDTIKQSATSNRKRVFVVETQGGYCGYLATMGGLAAGADTAYISEEEFNIHDLLADVEHMINKFKGGIERGLVLRNEKCSDNFTTDFMVNLFQAEGKGILHARSCILGHLQQGGNPSPYDRIYGAKISSKASEKMIEFAEKHYKDGKVDTGEDPETACMVGVVGKSYAYTSLQELQKITNFKKRLPTKQWWCRLRLLLRNLAKHKEGIFSGEAAGKDTCGPENSSDVDASKTSST